MSLHHTHLIHRSGPNLSNDRRIGFGISYIPTSRGAGRASAIGDVGAWRGSLTAISPTSLGRSSITALPNARRTPRRCAVRAQNVEEVLRYEAAQ